jgi:phosphate transport system substrate-binding protein
MTTQRNGGRPASMPIRKLRLPYVIAVTGALAVLPWAGTASAAAPRPAGTPVLVVAGAGSSSPAIAIQRWIATASQFGVHVVFTPNGSAAGRQDFADATTDYAVSEIGYQGYNPVAGTNDVSHRPYAYVPITAGATAFPYHLVVGGKRITSLRLSGRTLAKIFTKKSRTGMTRPSLGTTTASICRACRSRLWCPRRAQVPPRCSLST